MRAFYSRQSLKIMIPARQVCSMAFDAAAPPTFRSEYSMWRPICSEGGDVAPQTATTFELLLRARAFIIGRPFHDAECAASQTFLLIIMTNCCAAHGNSETGKLPSKRLFAAMPPSSAGRSRRSPPTEWLAFEAADGGTPPPPPRRSLFALPPVTTAASMKMRR